MVTTVDTVVCTIVIANSLVFCFFCFGCSADVNGKVVHLVQRTPPGSTPRSVSGSNINNSEARNRRSNDNRNSPFLRSIDGMVVGAMAIPMNANAGVSTDIDTMDTSSLFQ